MTYVIFSKDGANPSGFFTGKQIRLSQNLTKQFHFFKDPSTPKPKRMMYSTPMDNIQAQFDEDNTFDDHLVKYVPQLRSMKFILYKISPLTV